LLRVTVTVIVILALARYPDPRIVALEPGMTDVGATEIEGASLETRSRAVAERPLAVPRATTA
jgi:hypothetical protein